MEDCKQKYKEALERAKGAHNSAKSDKENGVIDKITEYTIQLTETIFPELKESEDEGIRKDLINYFRDHKPLEHKEKDVVAWLEKQGKAKHTCRNCKTFQDLHQNCPYSPIYQYKDLVEAHKHLNDETNCEFWLEKQAE